MANFPLVVEEPVYYCGFNSSKSYGGNSYFVRHPDGNWLIDSPKFLPQLVRRFEALGGIANIFLTHRDDVADARRYARRFGSCRYIHRAELASQPDAEVVLDGDEAQSWHPAPWQSLRQAIRRGTRCCCTRSGSYLPATIWTSTATSSICRPRSTIAGTHGRGRSRASKSCSHTTSSGSCPATVSGFACRGTPCDGS